MIYLLIFSPPGNSEMSRFLLFGQGYPGSVRGIPIQKYDDPNYESMVPILNLQSPRAVDFYAAEDYVYYADSTNYTIGRQKLNGTHREDLLSDCEYIEWYICVSVLNKLIDVLVKVIIFF